MVKLVRDKRTGDYYTEDKQYHIEKGTVGWNINELDEFFSKRYNKPFYKYSFTCETLKEVRESL